MIKKKKPAKQKGRTIESDFQKRMKSVTSPEELMRLARDIARGQGYDTRQVDDDEEYEEEDEYEEDTEEVMPAKPVVHRRAVSTALVTRAPDPLQAEEKQKAPAYTRMPWYVYGMSETEAMVMDLYAKGLTLTKINEHLETFHHTKVDNQTVNAITDKVHSLVKEWQQRPLSSQYMILYLDGIGYRVMSPGQQSKNKVAYVALGINAEGKKEILGIWLNETEGAKFWATVLNDIKLRGVQDILITCVDGLKGFPEAIKSVFPYSEVQVCVVHAIRHTLMHISNKHRKEFATDLKLVYTATDADTAFNELEEMEEKWPQYAVWLRNWKLNWANISPFFSYPYAIRRMIYTTNTIENLNKQFRAVTKTTPLFHSDEQLMKLLWLAQANISAGWNVTARDWGAAMGQFDQMFGDRVRI